jgi:hypothetical protein
VGRETLGRQCDGDRAGRPATRRGTARGEVGVGGRLGRRAATERRGYSRIAAYNTRTAVGARGYSEASKGDIIC